MIDGIKEEEGEGSGDSDEEDEKNGLKLDSPGASSMAGSMNNTMIGEGDDNEDIFMPLDEALESEFDINKVSKLDHRLKDINR